MFHQIVGAAVGLVLLSACSTTAQSVVTAPPTNDEITTAVAQCVKANFDMVNNPARVSGGDSTINATIGDCAASKNPAIVCDYNIDSAYVCGVAGRQVGVSVSAIEAAVLFPVPGQLPGS